VAKKDGIKDSYDLVVIGAGCVESESREGGLGGVCLNWGCIPTKALLESANLARQIKDGAADFGIKVKGYDLDIGAAVTRSRQISERLTKGVKFLFDKNGVMPIFGRAKLAGGNKLDVELKGGSIPGFEFDGERVVSSREALEIKRPPGHIVIVGAGSIGMEFADVFNAFGANVTIVEILPQLLPLEDAEIAGVVERSFKKRGIKVKRKTGVKSLEKLDTKLQVTVEGASGEQVIECDTLLMATGRTPNVEDLGLEAAGVKLDDQGWITVDEFGRTSADGIYAIGDVAGMPMLAHKATHEGIVAVEQIAGHPTHPLAREDVPSCTYCHPEVASIGRTEVQAKEDGYQVQVGKFPFSANARALAAGAPDGMVKIVAEAKYGEVLGVHMVGHNVTELIAEIGLGRALETTVHEIAATVHAHPTLSETIMEAALATLGRPIHI
jgi:dihydrolipoamide dehydrogenase